MLYDIIMLRNEIFINKDVLLYVTMAKYSEETTNKVKELLSYGFNSVEIAEKLSLHEVTVRRIKLQLKSAYHTDTTK